MSGVMYLGNQMISPVIAVPSGIDTSKYKPLPNVKMYENDYVDLPNKESVLFSECVTIRNSALSDTNGVTDTIECYNIYGDYSNGIYTYNSASGGYSQYLSGGTLNFKGPFICSNEFMVEQNTIERHFHSDSKIGVGAWLYITNRNNGSFSFDNSVIIFDNLTSDENETDVIFNDCLIDVTTNTNGKEFLFSLLKGSLGFYVEPGVITTNSVTFSIKVQTVDENFQFLTNDLYNVQINTREENDYIYKDITITKKTKQEIMSLGYTEEEYNFLMRKELENLPDDSFFKMRNVAYYPDDRDAVERINGESVYLLNKAYRLAQLGQTSEVKSMFSTRFTNMRGYVVRIGSYYPVERLSDNAEGFVDVTTGVFFPVIKLPLTIRFNIDVKEGDLTTHAPETPVRFSYVIDDVPSTETGNVISVMPGSKVQYTITEDADDWKEFSSVSGTLAGVESNTELSFTLLTSRKIMLPALGEGGYAYYIYSGTTSEKTYGGYIVIPPNARTGYLVYLGSDGLDGYVYKEYYQQLTEQEGWVGYAIGGVWNKGYFTGSVATLENFEPIKYCVVTFDGIPTDDWVHASFYEEINEDEVYDISTGSRDYLPEIPKNQGYVKYGKKIYNVVYFRRASDGKCYQPSAMMKDKSDGIVITEARPTVPFTGGPLKSFTETTDYSRPNLSASGTLWVDPLAVSGPSYSANYPDWKAFDGNTSTYYRSTTGKNNLYITFDRPVELKQMTFTCNSSSTVPEGVSVYGLIPNSDNTVSEYFVTSFGTALQSTFTVNLLNTSYPNSLGPGPFQGYKLYIGKSGSSKTAYIKELQLIGKNITEDT